MNVKKKLKIKYIDFEKTKFEFIINFEKVDFKCVFTLIGLM